MHLTVDAWCFHALSVFLQWQLGWCNLHCFFVMRHHPRFTKPSNQEEGTGACSCFYSFSPHAPGPVPPVPRPPAAALHSSPARFISFLPSTGEEGVELPEAICQAVNESPELVRSEPSEPNTWMAPGVTGRSVFLRGRSRRYKDGCIFWRSLCMLF